jgi:hypothetical protein
MEGGRGAFGAGSPERKTLRSSVSLSGLISSAAHEVPELLGRLQRVVPRAPFLEKCGASLVARASGYSGAVQDKLATSVPNLRFRRGFKCLLALPFLAMGCGPADEGLSLPPNDGTGAAYSGSGGFGQGQGAGSSFASGGFATTGNGGSFGNGGRFDNGGAFGNGGSSSGSGGTPGDADGGSASCSNGVKDGSETDVDCGGSTCQPCADGKSCLTGSDCVSTYCRRVSFGSSSRTCQIQN